MWPSFQYSKNGAEAVEWRNVRSLRFRSTESTTTSQASPVMMAVGGPSTLDYTFCHVHESPIIV